MERVRDGPHWIGAGLASKVLQLFGRKVGGGASQQKVHQMTGGSPPGGDNSMATIVAPYPRTRLTVEPVVESTTFWPMHFMCQTPDSPIPDHTPNPPRVR